MQVNILNDKLCRSRSVCKGRVYLGSAGQGLNNNETMEGLCNEPWYSHELGIKPGSY